MLDLVYRIYRTEEERVWALWEAVGRPPCKHCGSLKLKLYRHRPHQVYCLKCAHTFSPLDSTIFRYTNYSLGAWYEVIKLLAINPRFSSGHIAQTVGVGEGAVKKKRREILELIKKEG